MSRHILIIVLLFMIYGKGTQLKWDCPRRIDVPEKCTCEWRGPLRIECKDLMNERELKSIMKFFSDYNVNQIKIEDSVLMYLPKQLFVDFKLQIIQIFNTEILGLESDNGSEMFSGLENSLIAFYLQNVTGLPSWRWTAFSTLKGLKWFSIKNSDLINVREEFSSVSPLSIHDIKMEDNEIKYVSNYSFKNHEKLMYLSMDRNKIESIYRDVLPNPAINLKAVSFRGNRISVIPDDFFNNMPALENVWLNENKIKFFSMNTFHVMEQGQRFLVDLRGNLEI
ncbi:chaoptin-like [Centruroides sculpturatus]|uniref:chaoptin-like n=1 Tax=Centruroides sculpturatus TaxID=218467 RepID=UPI000C6CF83E|nr:chaoptin-like [Centruroides sculpturatus]